MGWVGKYERKNNMDYGLWCCRIETQYDELDDTVNKEDWLIDKINEITKKGYRAWQK